MHVINFVFLIIIITKKCVLRKTYNEHAIYNESYEKPTTNLCKTYDSSLAVVSQSEVVCVDELQVFSV